MEDLDVGTHDENSAGVQDGTAAVTSILIVNVIPPSPEKESALPPAVPRVTRSRSNSVAPPVPAAENGRRTRSRSRTPHNLEGEPSLRRSQRSRSNTPRP